MNPKSLTEMKRALASFRRARLDALDPERMRVVLSDGDSIEFSQLMASLTNEMLAFWVSLHGQKSFVRNPPKLVDREQ